MNASRVKALIAGKLFVHSTNVSVRLSAQRVAKTTKDSQGYLSQRPGIKSGTVTIRGLLDFSIAPTSTTDANVRELEEYRFNRTILTLRVNFGGIAGDKYLESNARMTGFRITGGTEDNLEVEATFQLTGQIQWLTQS